MIRKTLLTMILGLCACSPKAGSTQAGAEAANTSPSVVDSVFPMSDMLAWFRADIPEVKTMSHGADTRAALVKAIVQAVAARDTTQLESQAVSLAEYAWLYFPNSANAKPPYELPPALAWFRVQESNRKGVLRMLRKLGGHRLGYHGYTCDRNPTIEGDNTLWIHCLVKLSVDGGEVVPVKLFSTILERDQSYAILSYQNDF